MRARCPECSATYDVPEPSKPRRARCKCGATFLLAPEDEPSPAAEPPVARSERAPAQVPPSHSVKPKRKVSVPAVVIGAVMMVFGLVWALLALGGTIALASDGGEASGGTGIATLIFVFFAGACALAGLGLIFSQAWGWWLAAVFQIGGLLLIGRFLLTYLTSIDWDHPKANSALWQILLVYGIPFLIALALATGLFLPSVRLACGVKSRPLPARQKRRAGTPRAAR